MNSRAVSRFTLFFVCGFVCLFFFGCDISQLGGVKNLATVHTFNKLSVFLTGDEADLQMPARSIHTEWLRSPLKMDSLRMIVTVKRGCRKLVFTKK